jgi:hypothetical protein
MTPQEQEMIEGLIQRIQQTQLPAKDNEAEALLQQGLGRNPDSIYILAQTVLVQKYALDQAQTQLTDAKADLAQAKADLEAAKQAAKPHTSFLGSLLGTDHPAPPPPPASSGYTPVYAGPQGGYAAPQAGYGGPVYAQPGYGAPVYGQPGYGGGGFGGGGGFLQGAMQTAAGVAAGALAFEGIESLMHGFEHHAGYGESRGFDSPAQNLGMGGGDDYRAFEHGSDGRSEVESTDTSPDPGANFGTDDDSSNDTSNFADTSDDSGGDSQDFSGGDDNSF